MFDYNYAISMQEQELLDSIKQAKYVVVHPFDSDGKIRGSSKKEYEKLICAVSHAVAGYMVIIVGKNNTILNSKQVLESITVEDDTVINLIDKTSTPLCANLVKNADAFIGSHSCWMNLFWHFNKPTVCILPKVSYRGTPEQYMATDFCGWGFKALHNKVVVSDGANIIPDVLSNLKELGVDML
jgi:ADP-heptose:LPS heptosyltransferase